uniref:DUF4211 domain-containing protein n=1 Tax=Auxenochlorella protothecoides TaxID=3075 RepID=A0A1D2A5Y7_AUXPR
MVVVTRRSRALIIPDDSGSEAERHGAGAPPSPPRQSAPAQCPTTSPPSPQGATPHGSAAHTQPPLAEEDTSGSEGSRGCREWRVRPRPKRGGSPGVREGGRPVVRARLLAGGPGDYEDGDDSGASGDLGDFIVDDEIERTSSSSSIAADSERPGDEDSGVRAAVRRQRILARRSVLCSSSSSSSSSSGMGDGAGAVSGPAGAKTLQSGGRPGRRGQAGAAALAPSPGTQVRLRRRVPRLCVAEVLERGGRRWYEAVHAQGSEREDEGADAGPPTDEGDPSASLRTSTSGSAREEGVEAVARPLRPSPALGVLRATAMLGVQLSSYTPRQLFDIYCEYRLLVDVDPGYEDRVATSPQHQQYYRNAVQAVEWKLGRARDAAASSFWRSSARGLVEALETLPGIECSWSIDPLQPRAGDADQDDGPICQACRRSRWMEWQTTCVLRFGGGRPILVDRIPGQWRQDSPPAPPRLKVARGSGTCPAGAPCGAADEQARSPEDKRSVCGGFAGIPEDPQAQTPERELRDRLWGPRQQPGQQQSHHARS